MTSRGQITIAPAGRAARHITLQIGTGPAERVRHPDHLRGHIYRAQVTQIGFTGEPGIAVEALPPAAGTARRAERGIRLRVRNETVVLSKAVTNALTRAIFDTCIHNEGRTIIWRGSAIHLRCPGAGHTRRERFPVCLRCDEAPAAWRTRRA